MLSLFPKYTPYKYPRVYIGGDTLRSLDVLIELPDSCKIIRVVEQVLAVFVGALGDPDLYATLEKLKTKVNLSILVSVDSYNDVNMFE